MIRTKTSRLNEASLVAVSALDDIVLHMVKASEIRLTSDFLDWVADEATAMVEINLGQVFAKSGFATMVHRGDHRIALSHWVRHWVCPQIASRFESLAGRLPEFSVTSPLEVPHVQRVPDAGYSRLLVVNRPGFRLPSLAA